MFPGSIVSSNILIIGAGASGLATALELAQRGLRVTVLDRGRAGGESTWAGGGIMAPLLPWMYDWRVNQLSEFSRALLPAWIGQLQELSGEDAEFLPSGMLVMPPFDADLATRWCEAHGWPWQRRSSRDFLPATAVAEGLWLPGVHQVRNPALIRSLGKAAIAAGVDIQEGVEVRGCRFSGRQIVGVETSRGGYSAERVVLAAGAWSGQFAGLADLAPRIYPVRGQMLLFKLAPGTLPCIVFSQGRYLIPRRDGHVLAGSTLEEVGFDKSTTDEARLALLDFAAGLLPELNGSTLVKHWSGLRPGSPANVPTIGRHRDYDNLFVNSGHFRYGVTMAPGSARLLMALMFGETPPIDPAPYLC
jgi:glycine oxidase